MGQYYRITIITLLAFIAIITRLTISRGLYEVHQTSFFTTLTSLVKTSFIQIPVNPGMKERLQFEKETPCTWVGWPLPSYYCTFASYYPAAAFSYHFVIPLLT